MRTFVSAAAVLIGLLMAAVAVPAIWVDRNIVQEEGFVALAGPLGQDPLFQRRLASATVGSLGSGSGIPAALRQMARPILENTAQSLTALPGYPEAWAETLRKSHRLTFADPNTLPAEADGRSSLTLDVGPLAGLVAEQVSAATRLPLAAPEEVLIHIGQPDQRQLIERFAAYATLGYAAAAGAGLALALAFVAARRRWTVLAGTGAGALVLAGVWKLASGAAGAAVAGTSTGNEVAEIFKRELVSTATAGFEQWILATVVAGGALLGLGIVLRVVRGRRRA
ncbi:MAG: hypothetical protein JWO49_488 [Arthrobacter sp.]|nr:hypothetical protein [Arthrobacter sp.]